MPHKLKSSARRSRRNQKLYAIGLVVVVIAIIGGVLIYRQLGANNNNNGSDQPVKVLLQTSMGNITIQLRTDMPITAGNFKNLVQQGVYDGTIFHRVINNTTPHMIQGGDPMGTSIPAIPDEFTSSNHNNRGTIAMANAGANTGSSQFFINTANNNYLDSAHPVFGEVTDGMDVVDAISNVPRDQNDKPLTNVTIIKAEILP
jgi:peptidylprolyl isomerase